MNFIKNRKLSLAAVFIMMAVYNVIVFVIPFNRGGGFWSGYGFSMLAMLVTAVICFYAFDKEGWQSKFYRIPLISVVWRYLAIQLILGLLQMILDFIPIPFQIGLVLNTIVLGACLVGLITVNITKEEIERVGEKIKEKVFYIKSLQVDVESLVDKTSDELIKKVLKDLVETIKYSDPMSSPQLAAIENKIEVKTVTLSETVEKNDAEGIKVLCNEIQQLFAERNRKCKILM
ncbi:MAG: hypothetical protein FWD47_08320 [Treponema sp.]|nr:hypothetical protein [Treponema sp.]